MRDIFPLFLTDGAAKRDRGDVEIFRPFFLDVRSWKRGRSQRLLRLVSWSSTRDGQNERGLVRSGRATRDSETAIPSAVDAFGNMIYKCCYCPNFHKSSLTFHHQSSCNPNHAIPRPCLFCKRSLKFFPKSCSVFKKKFP